MRRQFEDDMNLRKALRGLPQCDPPAAAWAKIATELAGRRAAPTRHRLRRTWLALAAGLAVGAVAALFNGIDVWRHRDAPLATATPPAAVPPAVDLAELVAESVRLERTLVAMPRYDGVVRVGTASTIAGLEDHIAWIDAQLSASEAFDVDPVFRQALWQERVEMMGALIDVQYAQLPATVLLQ